jgi:hypothetical protein
MLNDVKHLDLSFVNRCLAEEMFRFAQHDNDRQGCSMRNLVMLNEVKHLIASINEIVEMFRFAQHDKVLLGLTIG